VKPLAAVCGVGAILVLASAAAAQSGLGITPPSPEQRRPRDERVLPSDAGREPANRGVSYAPVFIGPTARGETTELGF
jgi:hypothetical protein